jgi:hypothetical protein
MGSSNMLGECQDYTKPWVRFIYNHNPFYVVSAAFVLYGLHVSFAGKLNPVEGWKFTQLLIGYTLLLALTSIVIVRLGQVWEDARTLVLLVSLLIIALASSFDRVCLDDANQGARFLASGLAFSLLVCELLIRMLRLRFPWSYRMPFYLLLVTLFAYSAWLGHLSLEHRDAEMSAYVLAFPTIAAVLFASLVPANRRRGQNVLNNGTPWGWPLYPWSLFVLVGVGVVLRAYAMTMSFDPTKSPASGFQLYFLIPLILSWLLLWTEGADHAKPGRQFVAVVAPLLLLLLAFPGPGMSVAQVRYLDLLGDSIGSPIQVTAALLIVYFAYLWSRGIHFAEAGLLTCLGVLAFVDRYTVDLKTIAPVNSAPAVAVVAILVLGSVWHKSAVRMGLASIIVVAGLCYALRDTDFVALHGYLPIHLAFFAILSLGLLFHDWLSRHIAQAAAVVSAAVCILMLTGYRFVFSEAPPSMHAATAFVIAAIAAAYWIKNRRFADLAAVTVCLVVSASLVAEQLVASGLAHLVLQGKRWIAWGVVCFAAGLAISLAKGGQFRRLRRALMRVHLTVNGPDRST